MNARRVAIALALLIAFTAAATPAGAWPARPSAPADVPLVDPGVAGPDAVDELEYDLGDEAFKPTGFPAKVELKAKVYAPQSISGRAPLVILMHGRHGTCANADTTLLVWPCPASVPEIPSYQGYDALGQNLASHGMVVVSIGANGINANDGFLDDGGAAARAELLLEHLRRWQAWDASDVGSPFGARFVDHIDLESVGLMGHSRGGEGIAAAIQLNQRIGAPFGIRAAVALAPVDFARRVIGGVDFGVILPYCDGDVSDLQGASYYDDGRYASPGDPTSKMTAVLYGANHNFFNTVWTTGPGSFDDAGFFGEINRAASPDNPCAPDGAGRLTAGQQEQAGAVLMAGYLRRFLQAETGLARFVTGTAPYPASSGPARWSVAYHAPDRLDIESWATPATYRVNEAGQLARIEAVSGGLVCNQAVGFGDFGSRPPGVTSMGCPMSDWSAATNDTGALDVSWVRQGAYVRQLLDPAGVDVTGYDGVRMRVAVVADSRNTTRAKQDFTVVLEDFDGARAAVPASIGTNGLQRLNRGFVQHAAAQRRAVAAVGVHHDRPDPGQGHRAPLRPNRCRPPVGGRSRIHPRGDRLGGSQHHRAHEPHPSQPVCRSTAAAKWGCAVAQSLWGRDPDSLELQWLANGYRTAEGRRLVIAKAISSQAASDLRHDQFVQTYIQDEVDPEWVRSVLSAAGRRTWEAATVELTAGFAFAGTSMGTTEATIDAAYEAIVGRPADPAGLAYWTPKVEAKGPTALARSLVRTSAARTRIVDERYLQILGRVPDPGGRTYWVNRLATDGGEQALVASLLATESFRAAATH